MTLMPLNYNFIVIVLTAATAGLSLLGGRPPIGWLVGLLFIVTVGFGVGRAFFRQEPSGWAVFLGSLAVIFAFTAQGAAVYRLADLGPSSCAGLVTLVGVEAMVAVTIMRRRRRFDFFGNLKAKPPSKSLGVPGSIIAAVVALVSISLLTDLGQHATEQAVRSPWDIVPPHFLPLFGLLLLVVVASSLGGWLRNAAPIALASVGLTAVTVALKTYAVGFGFDPFIHRATESAIFQFGLILPKPFYYLGQYALVTLAARVTGWPIMTVDSWLVPILFAAILPLAWWSLRRSFRFASGPATWAALSFLLLPLGTFIMTTPQGLADALAAMTAFLVLPAVLGVFPLWPAALCGLAVVAVHPITGIPVLVMLTAAVLSGGISRLSPRWRVRLGVGLAFAGAASLPGLFILNSYLSGTPVSLDLSPLWKPWLFWTRLAEATPPDRLYSPLLDFVYGWRSWRNLILIGLVGWGFAPLAKRRAAWPFAVAGGSAAFAYVLLKVFLGFDFLISYERGNYANRLWPIALLLLSPVIGVAVGQAAERVRRQSPPARLIAATLLVAVAMSSTYLAYPRRDRHDPSRGWSTSALDFRAVRLIEDDARGDSYAVLANQSVSTAAISEFGFVDRYAKAPDTPEGSLYFYPVPTSSPLYDKFLAMNQANGHRRLADFTLNWLGVDHLYYVVSFYWDGAGTIIPLAKSQSDRFWNLENAVFVFRYDKK